MNYEDEKKHLTYEHGPKVRGWAGKWHQLTQVFHKGTHIGTIQTRGQGQRITDTGTGVGRMGVQGHDVKWLLNRHLNKPSEALYRIYSVEEALDQRALDASRNAMLETRRATAQGKQRPRGAGWRMRWRENTILAHVNASLAHGKAAKAHKVAMGDSPQDLKRHRRIWRFHKAAKAHHDALASNFGGDTRPNAAFAKMYGR